MRCRRLATLILTLLAGAVLADPAGAQVIGITNGFPYNSNPSDTATSAWLPQLPASSAGAHGFLKNDGSGNWVFTDGTPARFYGVALQWTACFPDSAQARITAARLRKLGVNLVRFQDMDVAYDWGDYGQQRSFLDAATGFRTLHAGQMARLDYFIAQLKQHGIYSYLILSSARAPRADDGLGADADSLMWLGRELNFLYPRVRQLNKQIARMLLEHVNPVTGVAYKNEPAIAMIEALDGGSILSMQRQGVTEFRDGQYGFSYRHSRRLDTLWYAFLRRKYGTNAALTAAWHKPAPGGGYPNRITEGSFEGEYDRYWTAQSGNGVNVSTILSQGDSVPNGTLTLKLRVRNATGYGTIYNAVIAQPVDSLEFNTLYQLTFKAKGNDPTGWPIYVTASQAGGAGMYAGLSATDTVRPYWHQHSINFFVPINSTVPIGLYIYFGSRNGDLTLDDVQLRKVDVPGLVSGESLDANNIVRIPLPRYEVSTAISSRRVEDQSEFMMGLERDYYADMKRFLADTIGARQPFTGTAHYWASGFQETMVQASSDFTLSSKGWDYTSSDGSRWDIRNISPLRRGMYDDGATITALAMSAHRRQPYIASFGIPFPNRYQGECMLWLPAYSSLQDWDGLMLETYADEVLSDKPGIDSAMFYPIAKNPVQTALMPVASFLFRNRLLAPAQNTLTVQHSEMQARLLPRLYPFSYDYAVPGGFSGRSMLQNRVVIDSVNAVYTTQADDISFPPEVEGQSESDTRQILWEYSRGTLNVDAPGLQGVSGYLNRGGAISLRNVDVKVLSGNETATIIWLSLDSAAKLGRAGTSFLTVVSRTEPTGWHWTDTAHADKWGSGPMLIDPVRVRLAFKPDDSSNVAEVQALDESGKALGAPQRAVIADDKIELTLDQSTSHALWYGVRLINDPSAGVAADRGTEGLSAAPNITSDRCYVSVNRGLSAADGRIELFDPLGRLVRVLHAGPIEAGRTTWRLDAGDLAAGVYVVRLSADDGTSATTRITVVR